MHTVDRSAPLIALWALLVARACADVLVTVDLQPPSFAQLGDQVTVTVTVRNPQGTVLPLEDVTLARVGSTQVQAGVTGEDGKVSFTIRHDDPEAAAYEFAARCQGVEQRVTIPVGQPVPPPDPAHSAMAFVLDPPGTEPPADALADPALLGAIRQGLSEIAEGLRAAGAFVAVLRGPAQALFVDGDGHRAGTVGGEAVSEVPGAEVTTIAGGQWWRLPAAGQYQLTIEGTDADFGVLTLLAPDPAGLAIRVFEDLPLDIGSRASVAIMGGSAQAVLTAGGLLAPSVSGVIDLASPAWGGRTEAPWTPPANLPPEMRPMPLAADTVIERAVFCAGEDAQGQLTGVGTSFPLGTRQVGLYLMVRNAPRGTELHLTWMHEGDVLRRQILEAEGSGASLTYLTAVNRQDLWPGNYAVIIKQNDRHIGTLNFAVR